MKSTTEVLSYDTKGPLPELISRTANMSPESFKIIPIVVCKVSIPIPKVFGSPLMLVERTQALYVRQSTHIEWKLRKVKTFEVEHQITGIKEVSRENVAQRGIKIC
jgi:hypothetical protein